LSNISINIKTFSVTKLANKRDSTKFISFKCVFGRIKGSLSGVQAIDFWSG